MGKYIKTFSTQADYTAAQANLDLPNVSLITENMTVEFNPYVAPRLDIITYEASAKLTETTDIYHGGLHTNAFNTTIKSHTFENGVGTIEFNDNVTSIGQSAFSECSGLTSVTVNATTPPTLESMEFDDNASGRKIYVPSESVETYKSASGWSDYASDIYAIGS